MIESLLASQKSFSSYWQSENDPLQDQNSFIAEKSAKLANFVKYWTGAADLQTGFEKIRKKEYQLGTYHLLKGSLHVTALALATRMFFSPSSSSHLRGSYKPTNTPTYSPSASTCYSSRILGPVPDVPLNAKIEYNYCEGVERPITIVTAYNDAIKDYAEPIIENQRAYAEKHNYCYVVYNGDLAHDNGNPRAPYWSKIVAIWDQWQKVKPGSWIVWMDASAIITNTDKTFASIADRYGKGQKDVIVTNEPQVPINNAVFALRKNDWTEKWIQKVWSRCDLSQGGEGRCRGTKQDPDCHFEQESMTGLWEDNLDVKDHTSLISNRVMNSFYRFSHTNTDRNDRYLQYDDDVKKFHWHPGDFICKVTGMQGRLRTPMTQFVLDKCIDEDCEVPKTEQGVLGYRRPHSNLR